jgi:hypothetical protein
MGKDGFDYFENAVVGKLPEPIVEKWINPFINDFQFPDQQEQTITPF